ncbi:rhodanese-like domain-containing protein [Paractinoplanes hotanensis]|uniref:Rhodanese-like domain-containing protein n=1 Tax=Paractinoplanes hotanensis TaxID=2906497 RepID=A0ABT0YCE7_9ACTN|nr:rhodanese-like domain-containing protein [Actinoplanes hotanensis]MCM4083147.1 rhodanese-like domain-containing protein [Actinoplanes hotanensis]
MIIVRDPGQDPADILWPALTVGHTTITGELEGGLPAWSAAGEQVATARIVKAAQMDATHASDVRQASETTTGHLPGAHLIELGDLTEHARDLPRGPVTVMCGHGERAATGASLLERAGHTDVAILAGGAHDWAAATGRTLDTGR